MPKTFTARITSVACVLLAHQAAAQTAADTAANQGPVLDEVIVTAQKRQQSEQTVPFAMKAFDEKRLTAAGIADIERLNGRAPGFFIQNINPSRPRIFVRGMGSTSFDPGSDPSVAVFVDEVYIPRTAGMMFDIFDVERVEVLKGPQGTLFGRNAAGGAISVTTLRPTETPSFKAQAGIGSYGAYELQGSASGPLSGDRLLGRVTVSRRYDDGYSRNLTFGTRANGQDSLSGRATLEGRLGEATRVTLTGDYGNSRAPEAAWENMTPFIQLAQGPRPQLVSPDRYAERYSFLGHTNNLARSLTGRVETELGGLSLVSVTGYRTNRVDEIMDFDASVLDTFRRGAIENNKSFSQELRLSADGERLDWIAGAYYFHEKTDRTDIFEFGPDAFFVPLLNAGRAFGHYDARTIEVDSYAGFGQASLDLTDRLRVTAGARYTIDRKEMPYREAYNPGKIVPGPTPFLPTGPYVAASSLDSESFDPAVTLDWQVADDVLAYAFYKHGYKSGGFQQAPSPTAATAARTFAPEQVVSLEAGVKSQWLDDRLRVNLSVFDNDYDDLQLFQGVQLPSGGIASIITNAAKARARGFEADVTAVLTDWLSLSGSYAHLDGTYRDYVNSLGQDLSGRYLYRSPRHAVSLSSEITVPVAGNSLSLQTEANYQGSVYFDAENTPVARQDGYWLLNARLALDLGDGGWQIAVWGKNLGDKVYQKDQASVTGSPSVQAIFGRPRTFGASATVRY